LARLSRVALGSPNFPFSLLPRQHIDKNVVQLPPPDLDWIHGPPFLDPFRFVLPDLEFLPGRCVARPPMLWENGLSRLLCLFLFLFSHRQGVSCLAPHQGLAAISLSPPPRGFLNFSHTWAYYPGACQLFYFSKTLNRAALPPSSVDFILA